MNTSINTRYYIKSLLIGLCALLCTACSDFVAEFPGTGNESGELKLYVPEAGRFNSRAEEGELSYSTLVFIAYSKTGGNPYIQYLKPGDSGLNVDPAFRSYALELPKGAYHFYLFANLWTEEEKSQIPQTEEELLGVTDGVVYVVGENYSCGLPATGLPMSAAHSDFFEQSEDDQSRLLTNDADGYYNYDGKGGDLYAVLTFMFAKVSVSAVDFEGEAAEMSDIEINNISERVPAFYNGAFDNYGTISGPITKDPATGDLTFYVPERYVAADAAATQTSLTLSIGDKTIVLPLGQTSEQSVGNKYELPAEGSHRFIARGVHYKYTLTARPEIILEVEDWSPEEIAAANASVYLHIEKQVYPITSGEQTAVWFDSNVKDVRIESPKFEGVGLYTYSIDSAQDTIRVWVNDSIPSSKLDQITQSIQANEGKYDYFHIVAGNIHKKITVTPLTLKYFLEVNPDNMSIIVSLRVASGEYEGRLPVNIHTNYPKVRVTPRDGWSTLPTDQPDALQLVNPFNLPVGAGSEADVVNGYADYGVKFKGLNSGYEVWQDDRTLTFDVAGLDDAGEVKETVTVTVSIVPTILNYKIHFKAINENWEKPHIYIYQCLEFPGDYTENLASQPIGYLGDDGKNYFAALEYSFTGALAFRGWDYPGNYSLLYNSDGSPKSLSELNMGREQGFYVFKNIDVNKSWRPETKNSTRYNFSMDFANTHRGEILNKCDSCSTSDRNLLWPGICMKEEDDGWYGFELTGIATPGKALIMFANGHSGILHNLRFPGANQPGIPLFDYPTKEGWFIYNGIVTDRVNNQFYPDNNEDRFIKYRIYWPTQIKYNDYKQVHIFNNNGDVLEPWDGGFATGAENGFNYFDFRTNYQENVDLQVIFHNYENKTSQYGPVKLSSFKKVSSLGDIRCVYFNNYDFVPGAPEHQGDKYRIYWPKQSVIGRINLWLVNEDNNNITEGVSGWPIDDNATGSIGNYYYYDFEKGLDPNKWRIKCHLFNNDNSAILLDSWWLLNCFIYVPGVERNCAYMQSSTQATALIRGAPLNQ